MLDFQGSSLDVMSCKARTMRVEGPAGTGKTLALLTKIHYMCEIHPGCRVLIVRATKTAMNDTIIPQYMQLIGQDHPCHSNAQAQSISSVKYPNGSTIVFGGLDKPGKFMGADFDFIWVNEGTQFVPKDSVDILYSRFRGPTRTPYRQMIVDCNPSFPSHWLNTWEETPENVRIKSRHQDNPIRFNWATQTWTPEGLEELDNLRQISNEALRKRMLDGIWAAQEGAVFDIRREVHAISPQMWAGGYPSDDCYAVVGLDWGIADPFSAHVYLIDHAQRAVYSVAEAYAKDLTTPQMARQVRGLCEPYNVQAIYFDEAMSARQSRGAETGQHGPPPISTFREAFGNDIRMIPGVKRPRLAGIDFVRSMFDAAIQSDKERYAFYIDPDRCPKQWEEFEGAVWHKDLRDMFHEDIDPRLPDHAITDCMYALRTHLRGESKGLQIPDEF